MNAAALIVIVALVLQGCNARAPAPANAHATTRPPQARLEVPDCNVALTFINEYAVHCLAAITDTLWIEHCPLLTNSFKNNYHKILADAYKADPELGLDADPIFDAQDFPDKGFTLAGCDSATGYVTVSGKNWPDFLLVLKVTRLNGKWLVDGAGIINIPEKRRAKR